MKDENAMGLSSLDKLSKQMKYATHIYITPEFYSWQQWFAWYPVQVVVYKPLSNDPDEVTYIRLRQWVWLKKIARRKVVDDFYRPGLEGVGKATYYEYTTTMELLKHGH